MSAPGEAPVTGPAQTAAPGAGRAQSTVRRIIVLVLLFALVTVAAIGLSGLLTRVLDPGSTLVTDDAGLARALAFTFIAGPLAGVLWWWEHRRLREPAERASLVWALYLVAMSLVALVTATIGAASAIAEGLDGRWDASSACVALVWGGVWVWHRWMRRSAATAPTRLVEVTPAIGTVYGLIVATVGSIGALRAIVSAGLEIFLPVLVSTRPWLLEVGQALTWAAIGAAVWWWHWTRERGREGRGGFASVLLILTVGAAAALTLFAVGTLLFVALQLVFGTDAVAVVLRPLDTAVASALVGGIVWTAQSRILSARPDSVRRSGRLLISAVALVGAASGLGVVVNALLASIVSPLVDTDPRTLLLGGLSALAVGLPVWWIAWNPTRSVPAEEAALPARRVYLIAIFGASAIVAVVTLLLIGFRLFQFVLGPTEAGGLVERIRAPFGLLIATAVVFAYHFAVWRSDRRIARDVVPRQTIGRVLLVTGGDASGLVAAVRSETGAQVTTMRASVPDEVLALGEEDAPAVLDALRGHTARRVLVVATVEGGIRAVPLED
jgi:hypothetical protein